MIISVPRSILRQVNCRGRREVADQNDPQTDMVYFSAKPLNLSPKKRQKLEQSSDFVARGEWTVTRH